MTSPTTRIRSYSKENVPHYIKWDKNGIPVVQEVIGRSESGEMTDIVTPGFHRMIRDGEIVNNPCNLRVESKQVSESDFHLTYWAAVDPTAKTIKTEGNLTAWLLRDPLYQPYQYWVCLAPNPTFDIVGQAKSFCLAQVDSTPYEFGEDLGELRETLLFLRNPLTAIADLAKVYKRRRDRIKRDPLFKGDKKAEAKALADLWNQYQFAFAPLVRSILSACEAWDNRDRLKRPSRRSAHGFSKDREKVEHSYNLNRSMQGGAVCDYLKTSIRKKEAHATVYYEVTNPLVDWQFALGLRLKDIPKVIWQLVPLSFMLDRVYNLSNAIAGLSNLILSSYTVSILAASVTLRTTATAEVSLRGLNWSNQSMTFQLYGTPDFVTWTEFEYDRTEWNPGVLDAFPPFTAKGLTDSVQKTLDLIALIISRLL